MRGFSLTGISLFVAATMFASPFLTASADERQELVIVTSYSPAFIEPFRRAYEAENTDTRISVVQRSSASATRFIIEQDRIPADIFWASAADAFELLKQRGSLRPIQPRATGAPAKVFGYPINDPDGYYLGFALSGYGFVYNASYLAQQGLAPPRSWRELLEPAYSGHIGMSTPSRSGTTHLMVEALLQRYGWDEGWAMLSQLGGNLSTITARRFGVASGVAQRRFGIGVTIDYLARTPGSTDSSATFTLPSDAVFVPASIGILTRARNVEGAERFVDLVLSQKGQELLLNPDVARIPIAPKLNEALLPPATDSLFKDGAFDARVSASRYGIVNLVFDELIVRRRAVLARLWKRVDQLTPLATEADDRRRLAQAQELLRRAPVASNELADLPETIRKEWPSRMERSPDQTKFAQALRIRIDRTLDTAESELEGIAESVGAPVE